MLAENEDVKSEEGQQEQVDHWSTKSIYSIPKSEWEDQS